MSAEQPNQTEQEPATGLVGLTPHEANTIVFALRSKADADVQRAAQLKEMGNPMADQLAEIFLSQASEERALADKIDAADGSES